MILHTRIFLDSIITRIPIHCHLIITPAGTQTGIISTQRNTQIVCGTILHIESTHESRLTLGFHLPVVFCWQIDGIITQIGNSHTYSGYHREFTYRILPTLRHCPHSRKQQHHHDSNILFHIHFLNYTLLYIER